MRSLLLTLDFPPSVGGIQEFLFQLCRHLSSLEPEVVAPWHPAAATFDRDLPYPVHRTRSPLARPASHLAPMLPIALGTALRRRPHVILCGHVLTAPIGLLLSRLLRVPFVVFGYAMELRAPHSARLGRLAVRHCDLFVAISRFTAAEALRLGAHPDRLHITPLGVDPSLLTSPPSVGPELLLGQRDMCHSARREESVSPPPRARMLRSAQGQSVPQAQRRGDTGSGPRPEVSPVAVQALDPRLSPLASRLSPLASRLSPLASRLSILDPRPSTLDPRPSTLLTLSRLEDRYKGHDNVLRALPLIAAKVPDVHYVVAGDGSLRPYLEQLAASLAVRDRVTFTGRVSDDERRALYQSCDVFVMPSRESPTGGGAEGFGIVFLEANAAGKPVVGGRSGGTPDAVLDGVTGLLVDPTDVADIAGACTRLLLDRDLAARLGAQGYHRVATLLTWPAVISHLESTLLERVEGLKVYRSTR